MSYRDIGYVRPSMPDDIPRLTNYREAQLWFSAVKPFSKGRKVGEKPLGRNLATFGKGFDCAEPQLC